MQITRSREVSPGLPRVLELKLAALAMRRLLVSWLEGLLWIGIASCALVASQAGADWVFNFPWAFRGILLSGDVAVLGWLVFEYGIQTWRTRLTLEKAALVVENHWPELGSVLISAVQLARNGEGSPLLVRGLIEQAERWAEPVDFRQAVSSRYLLKLGGCAAATLLGVAALGWWGWPQTSVLCQRTFLRDIPLPTRTVVVPVSRDFVIQQGETIEIAAKASGVIPRSGRVEITYPGKPTQTMVLGSTPDTPSLFSLKLPNLQQPLKYRFYLNDGCGPEFRVQISRPPLLERVSLEQIYPAYTGLPKGQVTPGNLRLLAGSRLVFEGRSNQPLRSGRIQLLGTGKVVEMELGADRVSLRAQLAVPAQKLEGMAMVLENREGCQSRSPMVYRVEVIPDNPPEILVGEDQPELSTFVTTMRPRLRFVVRDDFKVKKVVLCYGTDGEKPDSPDLSKVKRIPLEVPLQEGANVEGSLAFDFVWETCLESGVWKEGSTINYWIEAEDNNDVTGPGISKTAVRQWQIISIEAKRQELIERLSRNGEALDELSRKQEDLRNSVGDLIKP